MSIAFDLANFSSSGSRGYCRPSSSQSSMRRGKAVSRLPLGAYAAIQRSAGASSKRVKKRVWGQLGHHPLSTVSDPRARQMLAAVLNTGKGSSSTSVGGVEKAHAQLQRMEKVRDAEEAAKTAARDAAIEKLRQDLLALGFGSSEDALGGRERQ